MRRAAILAALISLTVHAGTATAQALADADVRTAVARGTQEKNKSTAGVLLREVSGWRVSADTTGFFVELYTPLTWIERTAAIAATEYQPLTADTLPAESLVPVFRVVAHPSVPRRFVKDVMRQCASVKVVVLKDGAKRTIVQALTKDPFSTDVANLTGAKFEFTGLTVTFPMEAVRALRGPRGDSEFYVTMVDTDGDEHEFRVKREDLLKLR